MRFPFSTIKLSFPDSIVIEDCPILINAEPAMTETFRGMTIDVNDEFENAKDSICFNREFDSNVIDERDRQYEKHDVQRISTLRGIKID
jgi:hypothetical protein